MGGVLLRDILLFAVALGGLALPWLPLLRRWPAGERPTLATGLALVTGYLAAFAVYAGGGDWRLFWLAPVLGLMVAGRIARADAAELWRDTGVRRVLIAYAILAAWCLGWHALVVSYSGAAWQVDWWEHYDRTHFFLARWPLGVRFATLYPLTARPPLVNLWSAALLSGGGGAYYHYQTFLTLLSCLAFLPLAALVGRWRADGRALPVLLAVLMASPLFVQNATFPWTKLTAAFFVLAAWLQLTAPAAAGAPPRYLAAAVTLAGGMLAHYSTGPWICALALAWFATRAAELRNPAARREIALASAAAAALLLTWIGWAAAHYGWHSTFADNTTVNISPRGTLAERAARAAGNLFHTVWPVPTVGLRHPQLIQSSALGRLRDGWFILYQLKIWWALGVAGGLVAFTAWWRLRPAGARFALFAGGAVIVLGTLTHTQPDVLGLAHVTLQPLALLVLAWLAAQAPGFPRWLARLWVAGLTVDLVCGIALHFGIQSGWLDRWLRDVPPERIWDSYTPAAAAGFENKVNLQLTFLADLGPPLWALALLAGAAGALAWFGWKMASPGRAASS